MGQNPYTIKYFLKKELGIVVIRTKISRVVGDLSDNST